MARTKLWEPVITPLEDAPRGTTCIERKGREAVAYHIPHSSTPPPSPEPSQSSPPTPLKTTIHLARHSTWSSGLHFHTTHTEYLRLIQGCIFIRLGSTTSIISASAGGPINLSGHTISRGLIIEVPKYARHDWGRADEYYIRHRTFSPKYTFPEDWSDDVVVEEWTFPSDLFKPLFFWNLNGIITGVPNNASAPPRKPPRGVEVVKRVLGGWWVPFQLFVIFWELDNWPVFLDMEEAFGPCYAWISEGAGRAMERGVEHVVTWAVLFLVSVVGKMAGVKEVEEERTPKELWDAWSKNRGTRKKDD